MTPRLSIAVATPLLLLLLTAPAVHAQDWTGKGRLQGTVKNKEGEPLAGATVTLHPSDSPEKGPAPFMTDKKGRWSYLGLIGGNWQVIIEAEGYVAADAVVTVNEYGANPKVQIDLRPIPKEQKASDLRQQIEGWLAEANRLQADGQPAAARAEYERALAQLPEEHHPPILRSIARTHFDEGHNDQAIAMLEKILAEHPEEVDSLQLIIHLLLAESRNEEAQTYIARLPEDTKLDATATLNMGIKLFNDGDMDGAFEHFDKAIRDFPDRADAYYYRGLVYMNRGETQPASADFHKLLEIAADYPKADEVQQFLEYLDAQ